MAKSKSMFDLTGVDPVQEVSRHLNKKGKLKAGDKKKEKALKSICPHHAINRKGKLKARVHNDGNGQYQCDICRDRFKSNFYSDAEYDKAYDAYKPQISQAKMIAVAVGADKETIKEVCELNLHVDQSRQLMRRLRKVGQKQSTKPKKKKKKDNNNNPGAWRIK